MGGFYTIINNNIVPVAYFRFQFSARSRLTSRHSSTVFCITWRKAVARGPALTPGDTGGRPSG